jgi:hypothetical protein
MIWPLALPEFGSKRMVPPVTLKAPCTVCKIAPRVNLIALFEGSILKAKALEGVLSVSAAPRRVHTNRHTSKQKVVMPNLGRKVSFIVTSLSWCTVAEMRCLWLRSKIALSNSIAENLALVIVRLLLNQRQSRSLCNGFRVRGREDHGNFVPPLPDFSGNVRRRCGRGRSPSCPPRMARLPYKSASLERPARRSSPAPAIDNCCAVSSR